MPFPEVAALAVYRKAVKIPAGHVPDRVQIISRFVQLARKPSRGATPETEKEANAVVTEAVNHGLLNDPLQLPVHFVTGLLVRGKTENG